MANVTQRINSYLGGVSKQPDTKKFPGQVQDIINGYPDTTFGLTKRPGFKFLHVLSEEDDLSGGKWFFYKRSSTEVYIGVILGGTTGDIKIWNAVSGNPCSVTIGSSAEDYLTQNAPGKDDFDLVSLQDTTFIVNKKYTVAAQAAPTGYSSKKKATVRLSSVDYGAVYQVKVTASGTGGNKTATYTTYDAENAITTPSQTEKQVTAQDILDGLKNGLTGAPSIYTVSIVGANLEISASADFTIEVFGGQSKTALTCFQDAVDVIGKLPAESVHDRLVRIANSTKATDDYWLKFVANSTTYNNDGSVLVAGSGPGYWEETISPTVSPGLDADTMPHILEATGVDTFTFGPATWDARGVGDDDTNPLPSFVNNPINSVFFYSNRLGFLTNDTVILSVYGDYFDFFARSALGSASTDPVDLAVNSIKPASLNYSVATAQGLILFSQYQQFLLSSEGGTVSPSNASIQAISTYESDQFVKAVDVGTKIGFLGKSAGYTHYYEMTTRGEKYPPVVQDVARIVSEWIPSGIDHMLASPNNNLTLMSDRTSRYVYGYRTYFNGEQEIMQAWFRWQLPANVQTLFMEQDLLYAVTVNEGVYTLSSADINQTPADGELISISGQLINPNIDLYTEVPGTLVDGDTRFPVPDYLDHTDLTPVVIIESDGESQGTFYIPTRQNIGGIDYFTVINEDISAADCYVGFLFDYVVDFPRFYYQLTESTYDFTAHLTIARIFFSVGRTGQGDFKIKPVNEPEWTSAHPIPLANYYLADDVPITESFEFKIPIYQRNTNFEIRLMSQTPYPLSLLSCMWEGMYNPKSYRRT